MRPCLLPAVVLSLTVVVAPVSHAQQAAAAASPLLAQCAAGRQPSIDSAITTVVIGSADAWNRRKYTDADRTRILYYADAIRQRFTPPTALGNLPTLSEAVLAPWGGGVLGHAAVGSRLVLVVKPNGRVRTKFWQVQPMSAAFAAAVYQATVEADTSHDFEGIPGGNEAGMDDTLLVQIRTMDDAPAATELPMMRARIASYVTQEPTKILKKGEFHYPIRADDNDIENEGEMMVFVGSNGKAVMDATQITRIDWRDFITTMQRAIEGNVYQPAQSGGCAVPSIVMHRFTFTKRE
jgi:hypothetical protein